MAVKLLENLTSIECANGNTWALILEFALRGPVLRTKVVVRLDRDMIPESTEVNNTESGSISITRIISASVAYSNQSVNKENRTVEFYITSLKIYSDHRTENQKHVLEFKWEGGFIPDNVDIGVSVSWPSIWEGRKEETYLLKGTNAKRGLIELILFKPESHFYFPAPDSDFCEISLNQLWEMGSYLQKGKNTTGWTITSPVEMNLWRGDRGLAFLAAQVAKFSPHIEDRPIRLALCPYSLNIRDHMLTEYLVELEVQYRLGVRIRIVTPADIYGVMRSESMAVCLYGDSAGFLFKEFDKSAEQQNVLVYLNNDTIKNTKHRFEEIRAHSTPWSRYKYKMNIRLSEHHQHYIARRIAAVRTFALKTYWRWN